MRALLPYFFITLRLWGKLIWKTSSQFFVPSLEYASNFKHFAKKKKKKKKNSVIVNVFPKLKTPKDVVKQISKKHRFRTPFDGQDGKMSETLVKSAWEHFYHIFSSLWMKLIRKISPLVRYEIWGAFIKTLTAVPKYPPQNCENSAFPIQMQLSKKREAFSHLFVPFLE